MKNKKFDQELKSEVENYHSSADPTAIWAAIERDVEQINEEAEKKDRKPLIWIFGLFSISLFMMLVIGWSIKNSQSESPLVADLKNNDLTTKPAESSTQNLLPINNPQNPKITEKKSEAVILTSIISNSSDANSKKNKKNRTNKANPNSNKTVFSNQATQIVKQKISTTAQSLNTVNEESDNSKKTFNPNLEEKNNLPFIKKYHPKKHFLTPMVVIKKDQLIDAPANELARILPPPIVSVASLVDRRRRRTPAWSIGLEIQGGAALTNRNLSISSVENQTYLNLREATESALETVQIGGLIELQHRSGFAISTGIQWSRIAEKYTVEEITTAENLENTLISYSLDMNQDTVNQTYDDILRTSTTTTTREGFNNYRLFDIPLLIGYHIKNETWSLGFQTGILTNLSLSTKGYIYDENSQLIDLAANQQTTYESSIGIGFYAGLTGRVVLNDHLQITASPYFRKNAGSFTLSDGPISQKYSWLGMNVGLRYGF